jgi:hypothetical protein
MYLFRTINIENVLLLMATAVSQAGITPQCIMARTITTSCYGNPGFLQKMSSTYNKT